MSNDPSIPRSKSVPCRISETQNVRSTNSADSLKPSRSDKKIAEERRRGSSSKNSRHEEKRYSARSPYYKGLTDSSKEINRQKSLAGLKSPGKDSNLVTSSTSYTSKSNLAIKVQEWSASYFVRKSREERRYSSSAGNRSIRDPSSLVIRTTIGEELGIHSKGGRRRERKTRSRMSQSDQGKPLRERASEMQTNDIEVQPSPALPVISPTKLSLPSPPPTPLIVQTSSQDEDIEPVLPLPSSPTQNIDDEIKEEDITVPEEQIDTRFTWANKYRPNALKDFLCNRNTALELKALAETDGSTRHFIFAGQPGVGKRTMIFALLREVYGHDKVQAREKRKVFHLKGEPVPSIQISLKESKKHVEINLSETKGYEKHVIAELIKERKHKSSRRSAPLNPDKCKDIILGEADKLSTDALLYIKWMIERYDDCYNKVFFCCSDITKLQPINSICKVVHLQKPYQWPIL